MADYKKRAQEIVSQLSTEEKAALCTGVDFWHIEGLERFGLKPINITDGPHGLRKQEDDDKSMSYGKMVRAVCFPPACSTASSFDPDLMEIIGRAIGDEARADNVAVVLGPGVNIKRAPLCGRNFEYFSEDPLLAGKLSAGLIRGIESRNIGTSVKHFAANNQESWRMVSDSVVDERALREIYLRPFEIAVKEGKPASLMCSYNRINGTYASDNDWLLNSILRDEWGFEGAVMTDWGATNDKVPAIKAGLDLSMPGPVPYYARVLVDAVNDGSLEMQTLDAAAERIVTLLIRAADNERIGCDKEQHHELSGEIAAECAVLLENDGVLPLRKDVKLAILGGFAKAPKFQGGGSSDIPVTKITSLLDALDAKKSNYTYSEGYAAGEIKSDPAKLEAAKAAASEADVAIVLAGLPASIESESFDRTGLELPEAHLALIEAVLETGKPVVVVLLQGSPTVIPFRNKVNALLLAGLTGQNGGTAIAELMFGDKNPCGRLAETYPLSLAETASMQNFGERTIHYRESIFVGYRWFDTAGIPVQYPFGYGLSYSGYVYSNLRLSSASLSAGDVLSVQLDITNTGSFDGKEVVQIYVSAPQDAKAFFPAHELKGFTKIFLRAGETKTVRIELSESAFQYFDNGRKKWMTASGEYVIHAAKSSREFVLSEKFNVVGDDDAAVDFRGAAPEYYTVAAQTKFSEKSFAAIYGAAFPEEPALLPFHRNSPVSDIQSTFAGRILLKIAMKQLKKSFAGVGDADANLEEFDTIISNSIFGMPFRGLMSLSGGKLGERQIQGFVDIFNGHFFRGLSKLISKEQKV